METEILTPFLNRAGAFDPTDWFQLVPKGQFPIARKEGDSLKTFVQVVDDQAVNRIVAAFANRKASNPAFKVLIDFEHFSHDKTKSSEAACWVNEMDARADGVWARGEWSDTGAAAIQNRRYRFLSPVWFPRQTERIDAKRFRPVEVNDAGLTNTPNLGEALQPFWNRADFHGREATHENHNPNATMKDRLIQLFKLDATATEEQVFAKVTAFMNRASEMDALQVTHTALASDHEALKNRHTTLLSTSVERVLGENKDLIPEGQKEAWKNRLTADFDGTSALLAGLKRPTAKKPLHDDKAGGKGASTTTADSDAHPFLNRVAELRAADAKLSEGDAILRAATEKPDLYESYRNNLGGAEE